MGRLGCWHNSLLLRQNCVQRANILLAKVLSGFALFPREVPLPNTPHTPPDPESVLLLFSPLFLCPLLISPKNSQMPDESSPSTSSTSPVAPRPKPPKTSSTGTVRGRTSPVPGSSSEQNGDGPRPTKRARKAINCEPCRNSKLKCDR